ncbi:MAG: TetR/AcrR family transcriptional regulator [Acidisphaera sp.]|nr:TetR/AcrR family transcriptional regulator [Acidisphaera sp.]
MRVSKQCQAAHRAEILDAAARLFRQRGVEAVGVAEVMRAAGLTHGGFYGHYPSKAALAASACRRALAEGAERWRRRAAKARAHGRDPIGAIVTAYLSPEHLERPEEGCAIPALAAEAARSGPPLQDALAEGVGELLEVLRQEMPGAGEEAALGLLAVMVGGIVVARASGDAGSALRALSAARQLARRAVAGQLEETDDDR